LGLKYEFTDEMSLAAGLMNNVLIPEFLEINKSKSIYAKFDHTNIFKK